MRYLILLVLLLRSTAACAHSEEVGFFTTDARECTIENRRRLCLQDEGLVEGDLVKLPIKADPHQLPIRWISKLAQLEPVVPGKYKVVFHRPGNKRVLVSLALGFLGFTRERSSRWPTTAATRGAPYQPRCERPEELATLLPGQPVEFSWCGRTPERIVIINPSAKVVFAQPVRGLSSVALPPDQLGLVDGLNYTWNVVGTPHWDRRELRMLDEESAAVVREAFQDLEKREDLDASDKVLGKASFLLFMSETYPTEIGLRWLSFQLLEGLNDDALSKEQKGMTRYLKRKIGFRPCGS